MERKLRGLPASNGSRKAVSASMQPSWFVDATVEFVGATVKFVGATVKFVGATVEFVGATVMFEARRRIGSRFGAVISKNEVQPLLRRETAMQVKKEVNRVGVTSKSVRTASGLTAWAALVVAASTAATAQAQTLWNQGNTSGNLGTASNWSLGLPSTTQAASLPSVTSGSRTVTWDASTGSPSTILGLLITQTQTGGNILDYRRSGGNVTNQINLGATGGGTAELRLTATDGTNVGFSGTVVLNNSGGRLSFNPFVRAGGTTNSDLFATTLSGSLTANTGSVITVNTVGSTTNTNANNATITGSATLTNSTLVFDRGTANNTSETRLTVQGNFTATGATINGTNTATAATTLYLSGSSNNFTGTSIFGGVSLGLNGGNQVYNSDRDFTGSLFIRGSTASTKTVTLTSANKTVQSIQFGASAAVPVTLRLGSNLNIASSTTALPFINFGAAAGSTVGIDVAGFTLDLSANGNANAFGSATSFNVTNANWNLTSSATGGVIQARNFFFNNTATTVSVSGSINLVTIAQNSENIRLSPDTGGGNFIDPASTLTYAGTAASGTAVFLNSGKPIGTLAITSGGALRINNTNFVAAGGLSIPNGILQLSSSNFGLTVSNTATFGAATTTSQVTGSNLLTLAGPVTVVNLSTFQPPVSIPGTTGTITIGTTDSPVASNGNPLNVIFPITGATSIARPIDFSQGTQAALGSINGNNPRSRLIYNDAATLTLTGPVTLGQVGTGGIARRAEISALQQTALVDVQGAISQSNTLAGFNVNGANSGLGTVRLSNTASSFSSILTVTNGTLRVGSNVGAAGSNSAVGTASSVTLGDGATPSFNWPSSGSTTISFGQNGNPALLLEGTTFARNVQLANAAYNYNDPNGGTINANGVPNSFVLGAATTGTSTFSGNVTNGSTNTQSPDVSRLLNLTAPSGALFRVTGTIQPLNTGGAAALNVVINASQGLSSGSNASNYAYSGNTGTIELASSNTYNGSTTLNQGTLIVSNSVGSATGAGTLTLSGGTLASGAVGRISGPVVAGRNSHTIAPGGIGAVGTLTVGSLALNSSTTLDFTDLSPQSTGDRISVTGALSYSGSGTSSVTLSPSLASGVYPLISYGSTSLDTSSFSLSNAPANASLILYNNAVTLLVGNGNTSALTLSSSSVVLRSIVGEGTTAAVTVSNLGSADGAYTATPATGLTASPAAAAVPTGGNATVNIGFSDYNTLGARTGNVSIANSANPADLFNISANTVTLAPGSAVVDDRVVTASAVNLGVIHLGASASGTTNLSTTGSDNQYTRVSVAGFTFNSAASVGSTIISPSLTTAGDITDSVILPTTSLENLPGEFPIDVAVPYSVTVFSGKQAWKGGNGNWATDANWNDTFSTATAGAPGLSGALSVGDTATFGGAGATVTVNNNPTVAGVTFNGSSPYTLAAAPGSSLRLSSASGATITSSVNGTQINAPVVFTSNVTANITAGTTTLGGGISGPGSLTKTGAGTLALPASASGYTTISLPSLTVTAGTLKVLGGSGQTGTPKNVVLLNSLSLTGGTLDLTSNDAIIRNGNLTAIRSSVSTWFNNGLRNGVGLSSTAASAGTYTTLAVFSNDAGGGVPYFTSYDGVTGLLSTDIIVKYTYLGDTNLDGILDGQDYRNVFEGYYLGLTGWASGDVDNSGGVVTTADVNLFLQAYDYYNTSLVSFGDGTDAGTSPTSQIPEPTSAGLLVAATALGLRRVRRRR